MNQSLDQSCIVGEQFCGGSFSSSFEIYAAIGGDPDIGQVDDLFNDTSKAVLNIETDENRTTRRMTRRSSMSTGIETKIQITTEVDVIDCDKLDVYFSSEDGIRCFSIVVTILVTSSDKDLTRVITTAENLALATELSFTNGEFEETLKSMKAPISILLMEIAPGSTSRDTYENDDNNDNDDYTSSSDADNYDDDDDDENDDSSSLGSDDFDGFLGESYREYLQDQNRQEILALTNPPESPATVSDFPSEHSKKCLPNSVDLKIKRESIVKFDPVVRVRNTLSRYEMSPIEAYNYWNGEVEFMTTEERDRVLKILTDRWTHQKEKESIQTEEDSDIISQSLLVPVLPKINQLLPEPEREGHYEYAYTINFQD